MLAHGPTANIMGALQDADGRMWFGMMPDLIEIDGGRLHRHLVPGGLIGQRLPASFAIGPADSSWRSLSASSSSGRIATLATNAGSRSRYQSHRSEDLCVMVADSTGSLREIGTRHGL